MTVVIPHLNQEEALRDGLAALHRQADVTAEVEIVVVDNGSRRLPTAVCETFDDVRLVTESTPGPGPARNRGVAAADAPDVLAFVDADCLADERWLATIEAAFADPDTDIIGGAVRVNYRDPDHPTGLELYEVVYSYRNDQHIAEGFSGTGNLAVRADVLAAVGPFGGIDIAEDRDWGLRAGAAGFTIRYVAEMVVFHPARTTFAELARKWDRHVAHDREHYGQRRFGTLWWLARTIAVAGSPLIEIPTVARSHLLDGPLQRLVAFGYLTRVRLYRAWSMFRVALAGSGRHLSNAWNRD